MRNEQTTINFNNLVVKFRDENNWVDDDVLSVFMNGIVSLCKIYKVTPDKVEEILSDLRYYINREDDNEKSVDEEDSE